MTSVTAIGVDDEEYVVANPTDRPDFEPLHIRDDRPVSPVWALRRYGRRIRSRSLVRRGCADFLLRPTRRASSNVRCKRSQVKDGLQLNRSYDQADWVRFVNAPILPEFMRCGGLGQADARPLTIGELDLGP